MALRNAGLDPILLKWFKELNEKHFGGKLPVPHHLIWSKTMRRTAATWERFSGEYVIKTSTRYMEDHGEEETKKVFLHEMVHHKQFLEQGYTRDNDDVFQAMLREVDAPARGLGHKDDKHFNHFFECPTCHKTFRYVNRPNRAYSGHSFCSLCRRKFGVFDDRSRLIPKK